MRFRSKTTGAVLEPRCEVVEAAMRENPGYDSVPEDREKEPPKGKPKGTKSGQ